VDDLAPLRRDGGQQLVLQLGDHRVGATEDAPSRSRQLGAHDPRVGGVGAAAHQAAPLERREHLDHRLRRDQRAAGELRVREARAPAQHRQRGDVGDAELTRRKPLAQLAPDALADAPDDVDQRRLGPLLTLAVRDAAHAADASG